ncbi:MAG: dioxygenase [Deltaproteobacteria bacterium]|nr:dioxygenase [Deltaproteobacteria bacterium]
MSEPHDPSTASLTRRQAILAGVAASAAVLSASNEGEAQSRSRGDRSQRASARMPVVYLPHGGGPWPFVDMGIGDPRELNALATYLRSLAAITPERPRALLVISAHWEEPVATVMTSTAPPMLYDYYGFPPESYTITWPAPGEPALAARVRSLLSQAGIESAENAQRGFDHGTFVPLKLTYPDADVPTIQLSLVRGLDPRVHLAIGRALAPLRDEGVLIVGSGMSYHNLRAFGPRAAPVAEQFDAWMRQAVAQPREERESRLTSWASAPSARAAHPREEHLLPLMVIAGAAGDDHADIAFDGTIMGLRISAVHFG